MTANTPRLEILVMIAHPTRFAWWASQVKASRGDRHFASLDMCLHESSRRTSFACRGRLGLRAHARQSSPAQAPDEPGLVTVAGSGNDDLAPGTLMSVLKQAGLKIRGQE